MVLAPVLGQENKVAAPAIKLRDKCPPAFVLLFVPSKPFPGWVTPTCTGETVFTQSINTNAGLFWKQPHSHTQK